VALLAGVTPEWYSRLEQGRDIHVSVQLLESLASVLRLDANERTYLFLLALRQPPPVQAFSHTKISPTLQQFLDQLGTIPACVINTRLNVVTWNATFGTVFGRFETKSEREQNLIWRLFTSPGSKSAEGEELARLFLAQFRAEYARFIEDPWWATQITELSRISAEFRELWTRHDVFNAIEGRKSMHHPRAGELAFEFLLLQTVDASDFRVLMYMPHSKSGTADKIERLQALSESNSQNI
jgi:hypothetical protein